MKQYLYFSQILVAVFLIVGILFQKRGSVFGTEFYPIRRGLEKKSFWATIFFGI